MSVLRASCNYTEGRKSKKEGAVASLEILLHAIYYPHSTPQLTAYHHNTHSPRPSESTSDGRRHLLQSLYCACTIDSLLSFSIAFRLLNPLFLSSVCVLCRHEWLDTPHNIRGHGFDPETSANTHASTHSLAAAGPRSPSQQQLQASAHTTLHLTVARHGIGIGLVT